MSAVLNHKILVMKRSQYLIDPGFQFRLMRNIIIGSVLISLAPLAASYYFFSWLISSLQSNKILGPEILNEFSSISHLLTQFTFLVVAINVFLILVWALVYSNKMAGPVFNMKRTIDNYLKGEKTARIHLRKGDYFDDLADKINKLMDNNK